MGSHGGDRGRGLLIAAAMVGSLHAGFSLHWALGGTWLVDTLGQTGDRLDGGGWGVALGMLAVAAVKGAVAWGPVISRRWIGFAGGIARRLSIFAGLVLAIYGVVLTAVGLVALTGVLGDPSDPASLTGHALLWDPLFAMWGVLLLLGLGRSTPRRPVRGAESRQASGAGREREALVSAR